MRAARGRPGSLVGIEACGCQALALGSAGKTGGSGGWPGAPSLLRWPRRKSFAQAESWNPTVSLNSMLPSGLTTPILPVAGSRSTWDLPCEPSLASLLNRWWRRHNAARLWTSVFPPLM